MSTTPAPRIPASAEAAVGRRRVGSCIRSRLARSRARDNYCGRGRARLDRCGANKYCGPMGRRDNRRSMKMRRRIRQRKLKARLAKKRGAARDKAAAAGAAKPAKKKAAAAKK